MQPRRPNAVFRYPDSVLPNLLALAYVLLGQAIGLFLLHLNSIVALLAGIVLVAHSLVVAGYLIHDLAHMLIFRKWHANIALGEVLSWIVGAAYAPFARIARMHIRHHGDRADLSLFDLQGYLQRAPQPLRWLVCGLEWLHIPAVELLMHYQVVVRPFVDPAYRADRGRVLAVGLTRGLFFAVLFITGPWVLLGYGLAYLLFLKALFLADAYAHTYEAYVVARTDAPVPNEGRDAAYDRAHTYSNLISTRWPWLNLLNLNFGYHNAHHDRPAMPWYRLPAVHRELYSADSPQILPFRELWRSIHKHRVTCILAAHPGDVGTGPGRADGFLGVHGVSFLSIV